MVPVSIFQQALTDTHKTRQQCAPAPRHFNTYNSTRMVSDP